MIPDRCFSFIRTILLLVITVLFNRYGNSLSGADHPYCLPLPDINNQIDFKGKYRDLLSAKNAKKMMRKMHFSHHFLHVKSDVKNHKTSPRSSIMTP